MLASPKLTPEKCLLGNVIYVYIIESMDKTFSTFAFYRNSASLKIAVFAAVYYIVVYIACLY
jgi:hypothetical protein